MSNKTQLQTNNTKYASLIELLRGKAAGSASPPSCTVVFDLAYQGDNIDVSYTKSTGGYERIFISSYNNRTITDVLCGSILQVHCDGYMYVTSSDLNIVATDEDTYYTFGTPSTSGTYTVSFDNS